MLAFSCWLCKTFIFQTNWNMFIFSFFVFKRRAGVCFSFSFCFFFYFLLINSSRKSLNFVTFCGNSFKKYISPFVYLIFCLLHFSRILTAFLQPHSLPISLTVSPKKKKKIQTLFVILLTFHWQIILSISL